jgi:hypothetical protein
LQSVVRASVPGLLGYPDPTDASPFPADRDGLPSALSPSVLQRRVHPLVRFALLQSSVWQFLRPSARSCDLAPSSFRGVSSLITTSTRGVHTHRASRARLRSARSVSHALDGLLLLVPCALVSSRCRVQGSRSRGLFLRPVRTTSRWPIPSRRWRPLPAGCPAPADVASSSGCSSRSESAVRPASPPAFSTPSGLSPETLEVPSHSLRSRSSPVAHTCSTG